MKKYVIGSAGLSQAIAGVVVGGQTFSLLPTTPVFYSLFDDATQWLRRVLSWGKSIDRGEDEMEAIEGSLANDARTS